MPDRRQRLDKQPHVLLYPTPAIAISKSTCTVARLEFDVASPSPELLEWLANNRPTIKLSVSYPPKSLASGWAAIVKVMADKGAPPTLQAEAASALDEIAKLPADKDPFQAGPKLDSATKAELLKVTDYDSFKKAVAEQVSNGRIQASVATNLLDSTSKVVHADFSAVHCLLCAMEGVELGPFGMGFLCGFCGVLGD